MAWLILAEDGKEASALRQDAGLMAAMWAWELSIKDRVLAAGSLRDDSGQRALGSLMVLDVATKEEALAIWAEDPANKAGMRQAPVVRYWNPAILDRRELA